MKPFLYRIAKAYASEIKENSSKYIFVFPNRRAGLFFQRYLAQLSEQPIFSPTIISINDCFEMATELNPAEKVDMLFRIFRIYKEISQTNETFDTFLYWAEMLIADFEEVDKYRVDAQQLFTNITDLKEISQQFDYFTENQLKAINEFLGAFENHNQPMKKLETDFIATWKILFQIYTRFTTELLENNTGNMGMISRQVTDKLIKKETIEIFENKQFVFIGFNALNPCERILMLELQKRQQADFYWDYEGIELRDDDNPASHFFRNNTISFPSKYNIEADYQELNNIEMELIGVSSSTAQAKQMYEILSELYPNDEKSKKNLLQTAVVLPDENMLLPLIHHIPQQVDKVNITMGYPLKLTPVYALFEFIYELQKRKRISGDKISFYHQNVNNIINNQYVKNICPALSESISSDIIRHHKIYISENELVGHSLIETIFTPQTEIKQFIPYLLNILKELLESLQEIDNETYKMDCNFIYKYYITINHLNDIIQNAPNDLEINLDTLIRFIKQWIGGINVPFIGEPLNGLQMMGMLEIRGLDFENLIFTSFSEGIFPAKTFNNSFIPYNLRKAFGLPTSELHDAIVSYNFYRLLQRAKKVYYIYDSRNESLTTGEPSRFIHQLRYHYNVEIKHRQVSFNVQINSRSKLEVKKTPLVLEKLSFFVGSNNPRKLSASTINTYIDCPLQFYFSKIENLNQNEELEDTVESQQFGTLFHKTMELIYKPLTNKKLTENDFDNIPIDKLIVKAFNIELFNREEGKYLPIEGNNLLVANIIKKYVQQILKMDKSNLPFKILGIEENITMPLPIFENKQTVNLFGIIDRIDEKDGTIRIIDYKTGKGNLSFQNLDTVFEHNNHKRPKYVLQTLLYCMLYHYKSGKTNLMPGIIYLREIFKTDFEYRLFDKNLNNPINSFDLYRDEFTNKLRSCIEEILGNETSFFQTEKTINCEYCPYNLICKRKNN